jgi:5'-methylthioadenosine phosphorylase
MTEIGIIGGTGIYDPKIMKNPEEIKIHTPYGSPSDVITVGKIFGKEVAFLPRHGSKHTLNPSQINYRANIWALKELGVKKILAPCAVGSLKEDIKPGDFVFVDQFIDKTFLRKSTFYEGSKVCHISVAEPICKRLRKILIDCAKELKLNFHERGTYICIEGPRFSTRVESRLYRSWGGDVIGMTLVPECVLAREAEICYASIAMVTDYDVWKEKPVSAEEVLEMMRKNTEKVKKLLLLAIKKIPKVWKCECNEALKNAFI